MARFAAVLCVALVAVVATAHAANPHRWINTEAAPSADYLHKVVIAVRLLCVLPLPFFRFACARHGRCTRTVSRHRSALPVLCVCVLRVFGGATVEAEQPGHAA